MTVPLFTSAIDITCSYRKSINECHVSGKFEVKTRGIVVQNIKDVNPMQDLRPESHEDIKSLIFLLKLVKFIPNGIGKLLPNLLMLTVTTCELKEVKQADLMEFPHLKTLKLTTNDIEVIEKDLFKFNPDLESIDLFNNNIKKIDGNVFDDLKYLSYLMLGGNLCGPISGENVQKIIEIVKDKCSGNEQEFKNYDSKETKKNEVDVRHGTKFWIFVGFGVVSGVLVACGLVLIVYRIIKPTI